MTSLIPKGVASYVREFDQETQMELYVTGPGGKDKPKPNDPPPPPDEEGTAQQAPAK